MAFFSRKNLKKFLVFQFGLLAVLALLVFGWWVYIQNQEVLIRVRPAEGILGKEKILLEFSHEMITESVEGSFSIEPEIDFGIGWRNSSEMLLNIKENLPPEQEFVVKIEKARAKKIIFAKKVEAKFFSAQFPVLRKVSPESGQKDVDYNDSIVFNLEDPLEKGIMLKFSADPMTGFEAKLNEERDKLIVVPKESLAKKTNYSISLEAAHKFSQEKRMLYEGTFETKIPPQVVFSFDENGTLAKTEDRKEEVVPQIREGKYIDIDISSQSMFLFENGTEKGAFKVSTGLRGMDTPQGTFKVMAKSKRPWSAKYKLYMPWFIQFTNQGHGIHELPEWPGGYKEGANHLGIPVSHGCVRLGVGPAKVVYDFAEVGVPIVIHW